MRWLDRIPLSTLAIAALLLGLAPFVSEPHLWEKLKMLFAGTLTRPIDILDLVMHGAQLVLTSQRNGRSLALYVPPDCPDLGRYLQLVHHLSYRSFQPRRQFIIEEINGEQATKSPYLAALEQHFNVVADYGAVRVQREI